jgi:hypothetical protein
MQGQATVEAGLQLDLPVLVLLSDKSYLQPTWSSDAASADVALNVEIVAHRSLSFGDYVTIARIHNALHEVILSPLNHAPAPTTSCPNGPAIESRHRGPQWHSTGDEAWDCLSLPKNLREILLQVTFNGTDLVNRKSAIHCDRLSDNVR